MNKTKEQLAEDKEIALSFRIKPLDIENLGVNKLRERAQQLWDQIVQLESDKYDLEERQKRQDYDVCDVWYTWKCLLNDLVFHFYSISKVERIERTSASNQQK